MNREASTAIVNDERFIIRSKNYVVQYNEIYLQRLKLMKNHVRDQAVYRWRNEVKYLDKIVDLEINSVPDGSEHGKEYVLIGILYKDLRMRGSILNVVNKGVGGVALKMQTVLASNRDTLVLEDESGRVQITIPDQLTSSKAVQEVVTGIVMAVKGRMNKEQGTFQVNDFVYSFSLTKELSTKDNISLRELQNHTDSRLVLFVSGLHVNEADGVADHADLRLQLLADFISGRISLGEGMNSLAQKIIRVVIVGDSVAIAKNVSKASNSATKDSNASKSKHSMSLPSKQLDLFISQLVSSCHVDLMPGFDDPTNIAMPQQPLHPCLFPHSSRFSTFERVTNPHEVVFQASDRETETSMSEDSSDSTPSVVLLGHAGQALSDIARQTCFPGANNSHLTRSNAVTEEDEDVTMQVKLDMHDDDDDDAEAMLVEESEEPAKLDVDLADANSRLQILQRTLLWGHLCPTMPDTNPCYPCTHDDPFIIKAQNIPDLLYAGNQPDFATTRIEIETALRRNRDENFDMVKKSVRLLCIPKFSSTGIAVLCDISRDDFPCLKLQFN